MQADSTGIALWSWHTPYAQLLARALPQWRCLLVPTPFAPTGWLDHQRPRPENVTLVRDLAQAYGRHRLLRCVVLAQTAADLDALDQFFFPGGSTWRTLGEGAVGRDRWPLPVVFASHNRAEFEDAAVPRFAAATVMPLVCISELKRASWAAAGYDRPITVIPPGLPPEYSLGGDWIGDRPHVLTVANDLRRPLFAVDAWLEATRGLPVRLVGEYNDGIVGAVGPAPSWAALQEEYRRARVYLSGNRWPYEDGYNLASLEAAAIGCPIVALDAWPPGTTSVPDWFARRCRDGAELRATLEAALTQAPNPHDQAVSRMQRQSMAEQFGWRAFCRRWQAVLEEASDG